MSIERLQSHYGFTRMPFGKDLAPGMLHAHRAHSEAVARISWCITEQAIGVISGECGAGKTVAARAAVAALDSSRHTILYLGTPGVGLRGIYTTIITGLGESARFHHAALIPQAQDLLAAESSERGKQVLLICDEAHLLDGECLEGIRCLGNMGMDQSAPFCLLLLGQPTLAHRLRRGAFTALDQRVGMRYTIGGLARRRRPRATWPITSRSPAAPTRSSVMTRSRSSMRSPVAFPGRSTTSRSPR